MTYVANVAGIYELSVLCRDVHAADSPYPVRVLPGPVVFARTLVSGVQSVVRPGETMEFEIHARDRFGNRCTSDPDADGPLEVLLDGSGDAVRVVRAGDGRMIVRIPIEEGAPNGMKVLRVLLGGRDIPGTPFSIECGIGDDGMVPRTAMRAAEGPEHGVERSKWDAFVFEDDDGWDSGTDEGDGEAGEENKVPVVENLEDLWLVSKLQQERKAKEAQEKKSRVEAMRRTLEASFEKDSEEDERTADFRAFLGGLSDDVMFGGGDRASAASGGERVVAGDGGRARSLSRAARALDDV